MMRAMKRCLGLICSDNVPRLQRVLRIQAGSKQAKAARFLKLYDIVVDEIQSKWRVSVASYPPKPA